MTCLYYFFLLNFAITACKGSGNLAITQPFAFESWSNLIKQSKSSSKEFKKNPQTYTGKSATIVKLSLEPKKLLNVDLDKEVSNFIT